MSRLLAVKLVRVKVDKKNAVLHLLDEKGVPHTKTYPLSAFRIMAELITNGQASRGLIGLDMDPDATGKRLVSTLDDKALANMGNRQSSGPAAHLVQILRHAQDGEWLRRAMAEGASMTIQNRFLDK